MDQTEVITTSSANTMINGLTDRLEIPTPTEKKIPEFQQRLESLVETLESRNQQVKAGAIRSFTNQPERVNISSQDDDNVAQTTVAQEEESYSSFRVAIKRPFLDVKSIQLLRASIPNAVTNIPDTECVFWYYRLAENVFGDIPAPSTSNLFMVRLLPSYYKPELFNEDEGQSPTPLTTYGWNRTFNSYQDLASELAKSCLRDPLKDTAAGNPYFIPGDISITYNEQLNRFQFTGNNSTVGSGYRYLAAGYDDPNVWTLAPLLEAATYNNDYPAILGIPGQPYFIGRTLNLRLGFTWNGIYNRTFFPIPNAFVADNPTIKTTLYNRIRPVPLYDPTPPPLLGASPYTNPTFTANTYADLVYTNTVSLYTDFVGGSTYDSVNNTQLLACVPMNASNLGVTFYNTTLYCPLTKISDQIYEIEIRMLTDTGQPYTIPNSAIVSLELALTY